LKYSPLAAVRKTSRKTSRIVDLFHSWFLKQGIARGHMNLHLEAVDFLGIVAAKMI
jgi:hypothetical protein